MIRINIQEAKKHLSRYIQRLLKGEVIILCKRNVPVTEIRPLGRPGHKKRPIGLAKGKFRIPKSFFQPLPDEILDSFRGCEK